MIAAALPHLGLCRHCGHEIRIRADHLLHKHACPRGDGSAPARILPPTFVRWLHAQARRRDHRDNPLTALAEYVFRPCSLSPRLLPSELDWTTADEFHNQLHGRQEIRQPYNGQRCDWVCRHIATAAAEYERLVAETREAAT
ncbi:hypothetical protein [Embleya sp. NPDC001921]